MMERDGARATTVTRPCARCEHDEDDHTTGDEPGCLACFRIQPVQGQAGYFAKYRHEFRAAEAE